MTYATERELTLARENAQLKLALIDAHERVSQLERVLRQQSAERINTELAALPQKWEPQPTKLEAVA